MGLDMYLFSAPKFYGNEKIPTPTSNQLYDINTIISYNMMMNPSYPYEVYYGHNKKEYPKELIEFYEPFYQESHKSIFNEEAYWRKAYEISHYLNTFYNDISKDYASRYLTKEDIIGLKRYAQDYIDSKNKPEKVRIIGYTNQQGKEIMFPKSIDSLILQPVIVDDEETHPQVPINTQFYTCLPLEYLAGEDWELGHALYTVDICNKLLQEFDFENKWLFYVASF